ncbi:MAG: sigma-70 family RNA polymerase sigma factor [Actinobacteria bacterium]|nr:sigma-70 family RNA polymerase sigma factor [Actinomycetota bacterium]
MEVVREEQHRAQTEDEARLLAFTQLLEEVEPRLRRALVSAYGPDRGREAAADALAWAWEHRDRLSDIDNVAGYLFRVGQSAAGRTSRWRRFEVLADQPDRAGSGDLPTNWDGELVAALAKLSPRQRVAVVLVHGYGYSLGDAASVVGCGVSSLRNHLDRALRRVRHDLEGDGQ